MWYFAWILGVLLACACAIVNALWLETHYFMAQEHDEEGPLAERRERRSGQ